MVYYLHGGVRRTPSGYLLLQNRTNRLPNHPYYSATLSGAISDDDAATPYEDEHFRPPIGPAPTTVVSQESHGGGV